MIKVHPWSDCGMYPSQKVLWKSPLRRDSFVHFRLEKWHSPPEVSFKEGNVSFEIGPVSFRKTWFKLLIWITFVLPSWTFWNIKILVKKWKNLSGFITNSLVSQRWIKGRSNMRVSNWWQHFLFCVNCPFKDATFFFSTCKDFMRMFTLSDPWI